MAREAEKASRRAAAEQKRQSRDRERQNIQNLKANKQRYLVERQKETDTLNADLAEEVANLNSLLSGRICKFAGFSLLRKYDTFKVFDPPTDLVRERPEPLWETYASCVTPLKIGFFERLFFGKLGRNRRAESHLAQQMAEARTTFDRDTEQWRSLEGQRKFDLQAAREKHEAERVSAAEQTAAHNAEVDELRAAYDAGEAIGIVDYNHLLLQQSSYPDGFPQTVILGFHEGRRELIVDYTLPTFEIVPLVAEYKYVKTRDAIDPKARKEKERTVLYRAVLLGTALRTISEVFEVDKNKLASVAFNGFIEGLNPATGRNSRVCVISVRVSKSQYAGLDPSKTDPAACLSGLGAFISSAPEQFVGVEPVANFAEIAAEDTNAEINNLAKKISKSAPVPAPATRRVLETPNFEPPVWTPTVASESNYAIPAPPAGIGEAMWVPISGSVQVRGFEIKAGMFYHGTGLKAPNGRTEPALIDPRLPVAPQTVDESVRLTDYWPSYHEISPQARRAYLQWLSTGKKNPLTNIGYVFLYFYGLERRALVDLRGKGCDEMSQIEAEVERLRGIYGHNNSFQNYSSSFLSLLAVQKAGLPNFGPEPPVFPTNSYELPLQLRVALGQRAKGEIPIDANWARAWALADPNLRKRTAVLRCEEPFRKLFSAKFDQRFPSGMPLPRIKTTLRTDYHPASPGLRGTKLGLYSDLPDVTASSKPAKTFQPLLDQCADELDPYSRYLGRNPGQDDSLDAILQLPFQLWPAQARTQLDEVRESVLEGNLVLSFGELSGRFKAAGALNKDKTLGFARALESRQVGMEPDVLSGAKIPKPEDRVILFHALENEGSVRTGPEYQAAAVAIGLAYNVAMADGEFCDAEEAFLKERAHNWPGLSIAHRKRLYAHLHLQKYQPSSLASYKKRLEPLDTETRRALAQFLAHLAQADGSVATKEVKALERVYATLGIDQKLVFTDLHRAPAVHDPLTLAEAPKPGGFTLDPTKIADLQRETAQVSTLLAQVFIDEETAAADPEPVGPAGLLGLDEDHSGFLRLLLSRTTWTRAEVECAASDSGLMVDGALDCINEAAMEQFEELLIEGDESLEINQDVMEQVLIA